MHLRSSLRLALLALVLLALARPATAVAEDPPFVLFVGNLLPHKNLLRLLDAFTLVARRVACRLVIRGDGHPTHVREIRDRVE